MSTIIAKYYQEQAPKIQEEFQLKNKLAVPKLEKIVINASVVEGITDKEAIEKVKEELGVISGQKPQVTRAKKAISAFKLKKGDPIGVMVTLRGKRAWYFLEKLISIVVPRMRDFRGVPLANFDEHGNYTLPVTEQIIFPEIDYAKINKVRGLAVTLVFKNSSREKSKKVLEGLGLPFKKD